MVKNTQIFLLALSDLIEMKKFAGRQRDLDDIEMLEESRLLEAEDHD